MQHIPQGAQHQTVALSSEMLLHCSQERDSVVKFLLNKSNLGESKQLNSLHKKVDLHDKVNLLRVETKAILLVKELLCLFVSCRAGQNDPGYGDPAITHQHQHSKHLLPG